MTKEEKAKRAEFEKAFYKVAFGVPINIMHLGRVATVAMAENAKGMPMEEAAKLAVEMFRAK